MNKIINGNSLEVLKTMEENSIDSIVSDPPYELGFMGKSWDSTGIAYNVELWKECLRVLKPGGHLLAFSGTRTYHRMACAIEDAGFEIRDQIQWLYGSGFPKSLNIGKAVDKLQGNERTKIKIKARPETSGTMATRPWIEESRKNGYHEVADNNPISEEAKQWNGWGTALKPANEPICVARKPLSEKTVAENVLKWGTGGINIDECRIGTEEELGRNNHKNPYGSSRTWSVSKTPPQNNVGKANKGRFPANIILDEEAGKMLDEQSGESSGFYRPNCKNNTYNGASFGGGEVSQQYNDKGGASRFFYCAKASKSERNMGLEGFEEISDMEMTRRKEDSAGLNWNEGKGGNAFAGASSSRLGKRINFHPTVKPLKLMQYLCRLVTPKGGTVLDTFNGSGSTGCGCVLEGFNYIGIDLDKDYCKISEARIRAFEEEVRQEKLI